MGYLKHIEAILLFSCLFPAIVRAMPAGQGTGAVSPGRDSVFITVEDLFRLGIEASLVLQADSLSEMMADEEVRTAKMAGTPDIRIGLKGGYLGQPVVFLHGLSDAVFPESPDWSQNYSVELEQPLYQGGRIRGNIRSSEARRRIAGLVSESDAASVRLSLMGQYLDLFCLYKQEDVIRQNVSESERRLKDIRKMHDEGMITRNDVLRSELQLSNDRMLLLQTENSITLASQKLDMLLGLDEDLMIVPDTAALTPVALDGTCGDYLLQAYGNGPASKIASEQIRLAENELKTARADFLPSVSLYAGNTLARPITRTMTDQFNNSWSVGISISYPISSLYRNRSSMARLRHNVSLMSNAREQALQEIRTEVRDAWLRHGEALEEARTLELSVMQAEENCRIMSNRYFEQLSILTDLLDADKVRLEAELQLVQARTKVIYTYYRLRMVCGQL